MKGVWRGNPDGPLFPPWDIFPRYGITREYFPLLRYNPQTNKFEFNKTEMTISYANDVRSHHVEFGVYSDPSWSSEVNPAHYVGDLLASQTETNAISAMMDIEYHAPDFVLEAIKLYRRVKRSGPLSWTLEPFQAGWFTRPLIDAINHDVNFVVVVQNFYGNMSPAGIRDGKTPKQELISAGIAANRVKVFYDGKLALPNGWDGCILSEERLP